VFQKVTLSLLPALFLMFFIANAVAAAPLQKVSPDRVCMVNDSFMATPQIPVPVQEKTYYGCCPGCVQTLQQSSKARLATDPVSKQPVDKATAVIGFDGRKVYYFESEETFSRFTKP
jgi:YHS domain-containing protein